MASRAARSGRALVGIEHLDEGDLPANPASKFAFVPVLTRRKYPTYSSGMTTPDVFAVLANPVRRRILELLLERPFTVNDLVDEFRLHRPSVSNTCRCCEPPGWFGTNGAAANGITTSSRAPV